MEQFNRTFSQFQSLYQSMSPAGRAFLVTLPLLVATAFGVMMWNSGGTDYVPLSWNQAFSPEELGSARQTLQEAGLHDFRIEAGRILVPAGQEARYNAVLLVDGTLPAAPTSELEKQILSTNIFRSRDQLQAIRDIELQKAVNRVLRAVPDIDQATVRWARSRAGRWPRQGTKVTATVSVRPRGGRVLSQQLIRSLQQAVANMVPDLQAANVTVFDTSTGISHTPDEEDSPFDSRLIGRIREFTSMYRKRIADALSYIPDVLITVNVDVDNLKRSVSREQLLDPKKMVPRYSQEETVTENSRRQAAQAEPGVRPNQARSLSRSSGPEQSSSVERAVTTAANLPSWKITETELIAAMPSSVQVSVAIPQSYFRAAAQAQQSEGDDASGSTPAAGGSVKGETEILEDVRQTVARAIGATSKPEEVQVHSYVAVEPDVPELKTSLVDQAGAVMAEWGSAIGLALFGLVALWLLHRTSPVPVKQEATPDPLPLFQMNQHADGEQEGENEPVLSERDRLQQIVRNNPDVASAVLSKWLTTDD